MTWPDGPRLRGLMRRRGLTPRGLAERSGRSVPAVHNYLCGRKRPSPPALQSLLAALSATPDDLAAAEPIGRESDPHRYARSLPR